MVFKKNLYGNDLFRFRKSKKHNCWKQLGEEGGVRWHHEAMWRESWRVDGEHGGTCDGLLGMCCRTPLSYFGFVCLEKDSTHNKLGPSLNEFMI